MIITEIEESIPCAGSGVDRSEGVHVTDIIHHILSEINYFTRRDSGEGIPPAFAELGFNWEDILSYGLRERMADRPGEYELDGIIGSPDGITITDDGIIIEEYKCTWFSMKWDKDFGKQLHWIMQTKAYCKMVGTLTCLFRIFWINGNYAPPQPVYKAYLVEYTQLEVDENWEMLVNTARHLGWIK